VTKREELERRLATAVTVQDLAHEVAAILAEHEDRLPARVEPQTKAVAPSAEQVLQEVADKLRALYDANDSSWRDALTVAWNLVMAKLDAVRAAPKEPL
jgi:hypothetical protein